MKQNGRKEGTGGRMLNGAPGEVKSRPAVIRTPDEPQVAEAASPGAQPTLSYTEAMKLQGDGKLKKAVLSDQGWVTASSPFNRRPS